MRRVIRDLFFSLTPSILQTRQYQRRMKEWMVLKMEKHTQCWGSLQFLRDASVLIDLLCQGRLQQLWWPSRSWWFRVSWQLPDLISSFQTSSATNRIWVSYSSRVSCVLNCSLLWNLEHKTLLHTTLIITKPTWRRRVKMLIVTLLSGMSDCQLVSDCLILLNQVPILSGRPK